MTLAGLLEINRDFLRPTDKVSLALAEFLWTQYGEPVTVQELADTLETIMETCTKRGLLYPAILLKRKKELMRGTWKPKLHSPMKYARPVLPGAAGCPQCKGTGIIVQPGGGAGSICNCGAFLKSVHAKQESQEP